MSGKSFRNKYKRWCHSAVKKVVFFTNKSEKYMVLKLAIIDALRVSPAKRYFRSSSIVA